MKKQKLFLSLLMLLAFSVGAWAVDYELMLTLDLAGASKTGGSSAEITTNDGLLTFLQNSVSTKSNIKSASKTSGKIYGAKGSGGAGIPDDVLKIGTASAAAAFSFTVADALDSVAKVEITGYGWKTSTAVSINSSTAQKPTTAASEVTFAYELKTASKTISVSVSSSAFCATEIKLYKAATKKPGVSVEPTSVAFGDVKQHTVDEYGSQWVMTPLKITGENLTDNVTLTSDYPTVINIENKGLAAGVAPSYTLTPDGNGAIDTTVNVVAYTSTAQELTKKITISSAKATPEFTAVEVPVTINITETFAVGVEVKEGQTSYGSVSISGGVSGGNSFQYTGGDEELTIVATPKAGYEFVNWTYSEADGDHLLIDDEEAATTTVTADAAVTIIANFQEQSCTNLAAPTLDEENTQTSYTYANLAWTAVTNALKYRINVTEHDGEAVLTNLLTPDLSTNVLNLKANTRYDYTVMAVGDGSTYCDESNALLEGYFTTKDYPAATLTLSENGKTRVLAGEYKLNDVVTLPTEVVTGVVGKVFVGWDANAECATAPTYAKGAEYTIASTTDKLYAVYATATPSKVEANIVNVDGNGGKKALSDSTFITVNVDTDYGENNKPYLTKFSNTGHYILFSLDNAPKSLGFTYKMIGGATASKMAIQECATEDGEFTTVQEFSISGTQNSTGNFTTTNAFSQKYVRMYFTKGSNVGVGAILLVGYKNGAPTYSAYATTGARLLANPTFGVAAGTYTEAQNVTLSAAEGTIYYTLDGTDPTAESTEYTAAIALSTYGEHTIKAIAIDGDNKSEIVSATYMIKVPFTSLEELVEKLGTTTTDNIKVSFSEVEITEFNYSRTGIYLNADAPAGNTNKIQLFISGTAAPESWVAGGKLSATEISGNWDYYSKGSQWEIVLTSWEGLTYTKAPAGLAWSAASATATYAAQDNEYPALTNSKNFDVTYSSSAEAVATINAETGVITLVKAGETTIKATFAGNDSYAAQEVSYTLTVNKGAAGLAWSAATGTAYTVKKEYTLPTLTNALELAVTYESTATAVATIDEAGKVTPVDAGETTIKAIFAGNDQYAAQEVSYTLTVKAPVGLVLNGTLTQTAYELNDKINLEGLSVDLSFGPSDYFDITDEVTWKLDGLSLEEKKVTASATYTVRAEWESFSDYKQFALTVNTHAVTFGESITVKNAGVAITSGDAFTKGTVLTVEASKDRHVLATLTAGGVDILEAKQFTVGTEDIEVVATFTAVKFYITGNEEFTGYNWEPAGVKALEDSYTFKNVPAGSHVFKLSLDGTWSNMKGFDDLTQSELIAGLYAGENGNIHFTLAEAGDVTITYTNEVFKVYGALVPQTVYLAGDLNSWSTTADAAVLSADRKSATATKTIEAETWVTFKMYVDNKWMGWNGDGVEITRSVNTASELINDGKNLWFQADVTGEYQFTWIFGYNEVVITFPAKGGADAIDNTAAEVKAVKTLENGMIIIRRGDKTYTIDGQRVR